MDVIVVDCTSGEHTTREATADEVAQRDADGAEQAARPPFPPLPPTGVGALTLFLKNILTADEAVVSCGYPAEHLNHEAIAWLAAAG